MKNKADKKEPNYKNFLSLLALALFFSWLPCQADTASASVTFTWKANPASENVEGYRIYYGPKSRFDQNGKLKTNFYYTYLIDTRTSQLCTGRNYQDCRNLSAKELNCMSLHSGNPYCTIANVAGVNYYSLQAYSFTEKSKYTHEIKFPNTPQNLAAASAARSINMLLLDQF